MIIQGLQKTTLLDFPGKVAATVFTGGCNFRCPFCHNASLVTHVQPSEQLDTEEVLSYFRKRRNILDGVCITGGEPLLQSDIRTFCLAIRELGLSIKLDTNGSRPAQLKSLIDEGLLDYIAMDVKNSRTEYARTCGLPAFPEEVEESIRLIMECGVPYEFRTTVVRELHSPRSIRELAEWIKGADRYFLQCFIDSGDLIGDSLSPCTPEEMTELLQIAQQFVPSARLRGM